MSDKLPPRGDFALAVRARHIDLGKRGNVHLCPIAQALREAFPCVTQVFVEGYTARLEIADDGPTILSAKRWTVWHYHHDGGDFIDRFDTRKSVKPTTVQFRSADLLPVEVRVRALVDVVIKAKAPPRS